MCVVDAPLIGTPVKDPSPKPVLPKIGSGVPTPPSTLPRIPVKGAKVK